MPDSPNTHKRPCAISQTLRVTVMTNTRNMRVTASEEHDDRRHKKESKKRDSTSSESSSCLEPTPAHSSHFSSQGKQSISSSSSDKTRSHCNSKGKKNMSNPSSEKTSSHCSSKGEQNMSNPSSEKTSSHCSSKGKKNISNPSSEKTSSSHCSSQRKQNMSNPSSEKVRSHCSSQGKQSMSNTSSEKTRKARFYRNGDCHFKGLVLTISSNICSFDSLLSELTHSLSDKVSLPKGVRTIYTIDGRHKITSLEELQEGESYVCASNEPFCPVDYKQNPTHALCLSIKVETSEAWDYTSSWRSEGKDSHDLTTGKLISVILGGKKPRKTVKILLNTKTAHSFEHVLRIITKVVRPESGEIKKLFTLERKQVTSLEDIFGDDNVFIAYESEKSSTLPDNSVLDNSESLPESSGACSSSVKYSASSSAGTSSENKPSASVSGPLSTQLDIPTSPKSASTSANQDILPTTSQEVKKLSAEDRSSSKINSKPELDHLVNSDGMSRRNRGIELTAFLDKYKIGKVIGAGNFSVVKVCTNRITGEEFALKIIDKARYHRKEHLIGNEVSILRRLKHPNIIKLVENTETETQLFLLLELVKGGDLFDLISSSVKFTENESSSMLHDLADALQYIHGMHIVHRDIKPENLLVFKLPNGTKSLKIGDFGLAIVVKGSLYAICGTPTYLAPEIISETGYDVKVDVWATGVITYILLCGYPPFQSENNNQEELFQKILAGDLQFPTPHWDNITVSAKELIRQMLQVNDKARYTAGQILRHPWVSYYSSNKSHMLTQETSHLK